MCPVGVMLPPGDGPTKERYDPAHPPWMGLVRAIGVHSVYSTRIHDIGCVTYYNYCTLYVYVHTQEFPSYCSIVLYYIGSTGTYYRHTPSTFQHQTARPSNITSSFTLICTNISLALGKRYLLRSSLQGNLSIFLPLPTSDILGPILHSSSSHIQHPRSHSPFSSPILPIDLA